MRQNLHAICTQILAPFEIETTQIRIRYIFSGSGSGSSLEEENNDWPDGKAKEEEKVNKLEQEQKAQTKKTVSVSVTTLSWNVAPNPPESTSLVSDIFSAAFRVAALHSGMSVLHYIALNCNARPA